MGKSIRATNKPESDIGQRRYELYRSANEQLKYAFEEGFFIECIAICESIISDRLEASELPPRTAQRQP